MKIIVNGLDLYDAVNKVSRALPARDVAPVLDCIKMVADGDKLTLFATDKDLSIERSIVANVIVPGAVLVPGKLLSEYIRSIAGETEIALDLDDNLRLNISSSNSECNINCLSVDNYPEQETVDQARCFELTQRNLKDIIHKVIFAVANDDTRPILKGVFLEANEYTLTAVATDGYRFAKCKKPLEKAVENMSATVPSRSLAELAKLLTDTDNVAKVFMESNNLMVQLDNVILMTRLLTAGQYIKYDNLVPKDFVTTLIVDKANFERSLNTASIMSRSDKNNLVVLDIEEYTMRISSTGEYGTAKEQVAVSLNGKDIRCSYNSRYINDCLKVLDCQTIKMEFALHNSCVITINNSDEVLYFILPVKQIG